MTFNSDLRCCARVKGGPCVRVEGLRHRIKGEHLAPHGPARHKSGGDWTLCCLCLSPFFNLDSRHRLIPENVFFFSFFFAVLHAHDRAAHIHFYEPNKAGVASRFWFEIIQRVQRCQQGEGEAQESGKKKRQARRCKKR